MEHYFNMSIQPTSHCFLPSFHSKQAASRENKSDSQLFRDTYPVEYCMEGGWCCQFFFSVQSLLLLVLLYFCCYCCHSKMEERYIVAEETGEKLSFVCFKHRISIVALFECFLSVAVVNFLRIPERIPCRTLKCSESLLW